ncbi:nef attachable domain protein [Chlamydia psittaci 02DC15]|nr:nef attachable domain protein [Chlamydia psittaci 02DC15]EPJ19109.1 nef attachable domain protein [Chlamydia psittaci 02DC21]EPJ23928.1 nef attachable domain protein [Chlamydia psittaci 09DC77]EPJ26151.1 nef attachable domain protein [Chlamydia psittaci 03DC29]EPJ26153.1 nef attachable domain protein [Chlamydia psittaci 09DC80]EPL02385.1 nef attachable domain protein [Chlamydia psittaci 09DC79]
MCSVNSSQRVTAFPSRSLSQRLFLCNLQSDIWKTIEGYVEKGNIVR